MKSFDEIFIRLLERSRSSAWAGIAIGGLLTAIAVLLRLALLGHEPIKTPYVTFYPLSTIAAVLGGWTSGIATTLLSAFVVIDFFSPLVDAVDMISCALFVASGVLVTGIVEMLYHGKMQAIKAEAAKEAFQRRSARDELLSRAATSLLQIRDPRCIVERLCREIAIFLHCDFFLCILFNEQSQPQLLAYDGPFAQEAFAMQCVQCRQDGCHHAAQIGGGDIDKDPCALHCSQRQFLALLGVTCHHCHPLLEQGRVIGALMFGARGRPDFDPAEIETMQAASHLITLALGRARAEERLQDAAERLRDADRRKDEFLAMLAHELRNPLAAIHSATYSLGHEVNKETLVKRKLGAMAIIDRQLSHLIRLVDDLLDVSRITRGKIELKTERVELGEMLRHAVETADPAIADGGHVFTMDLPATPLFLYGDRVRLVQVFANLLNNAAKYTGRGGTIYVTAERCENQAIVRVCDSGIGIQQNMLPKIFDLFAQADPRGACAQGGLGIGLGLVRNLVELHNGTVEAQSQGLGHGSTFIIHLPIAVTDQQMSTS